MIIRNHNKFMDRWGEIYVRKYRQEGAQATTEWFLRLFKDVSFLEELKPWIRKWKKFLPVKEDNDNG